MSWVTIVVIVIGGLLALLTVFLVFACCRMASIADNAIPLEWTGERIAKKLEDIAYSDEKNLSGIALNALLKTAKYYRAPKERHEDKIPLMCNIRTHVRGEVKQLSEGMCSRYILMRGVTQNEIDEAKYDTADIAVVVAMREIRKALEGEFPTSMVK
jgi:hypothetical protein